MKKKTFYILVLFYCFCAKAQGGELQFSQTKLFTKTISAPVKKTYSNFPNPGYLSIDTAYYYWDSITIVVPPNKTLKIENIVTGSNYVTFNNSSLNSYSYAYNTPSPVINPMDAGFNKLPVGVYYNNSLIFSGLSPTVSNSSSRDFHFPIWLPSGTHNIVIFVDNFLTVAQGQGATIYQYDRVRINNTKIYCTISALEFNIIP